MKKILLFTAVLALSVSLHATKVEIGKDQEIFVDGKPFFPIMQWAQSKNKMEEQKQYGINTFFGQGDESTAEAYAAEAARLGLFVVTAFKEEQVESVRNSPALLGWLYKDEPDMPGKDKKAPRIPLAESIAVYEKARALDKEHPMFLTLTPKFDPNIEKVNYDISFYRGYNKATDIIGYDIYPIYGTMSVDKLWWVASGVTELERLYKGKPVYAFIETSAGSKWISPARMRHPFPYEIRCEVWMAIIRGAKGIAYFTHSWVAPENIGNPNMKKRMAEDKSNKYYTQFGVPEENKKELTRINSQITKLTPVLFSPDISGKVSRETSGGGEVEILVKEKDGKTWIFAVNMKRSSCAVKFRVPGLKAKTKILVDEENRTLEAGTQGFSDNFTEHAVHIYTLE